MTKTKQERYCWRCGVSKEDVRKAGWLCSVWGKYWKRHWYMSKEESAKIQVGGLAPY